jgi:hypothetical protein
LVDEVRVDEAKGLEAGFSDVDRDHEPTAFARVVDRVLEGAIELRDGWGHEELIGFAVGHVEVDGVLQSGDPPFFLLFQCPFGALGAQE